jgi:hypothetical protein
MRLAGKAERSSQASCDLLARLHVKTRELLNENLFLPTT